MLNRSSGIIKKASKLLADHPKISVLLSGSMLKFCFCKGTTLPFLLLPAFTILSLTLILSRRKQAFAIGYCFGLGYFSSTLYWIAESFKCVGFGNYGYLAVSALVLYISVYPAAACYLARRIASTRAKLLILLAIFWTIAEYLRGIVFTGFPWNLIGYVAYDIPYFAQSADVFGIYGVSFLLLLTTLLLSFKKTCLYGTVIFAIVISYGYYRTEIYNKYIVSDNPASVVVVQPSISQEDKLDVRKFQSNLAKHIELSHSHGLYHRKRLIIWSEAAINTPVHSKDKFLRYIASSLKNDWIIAGCDRFDNERHLFNSVCVFGADAEIKQFYDKRHLLPFGEFIPEFLLDIGLRKVVPGIMNFSSGTLSRTVKIDGIDPFDVLICYEIAFPGEILDNSESTWIVNVTNDSWFKNSDGPTQHMRAACFRAIEEGRPIVRCANNGISCIIDCNGRVIDALQTDEIGRIETTVPAKRQKTLFAKYKHKTIWMLLSVIALGTMLPRLARSRFYKIKNAAQKRSLLSK
ncbi:MAG: apolipoprotein N-acyltransferase [Alphaproteobacteria bacterium]|nr:apolipoprotein N-acyltransferase [Alphaproteobacteria bacterium]